MVYKLVFSAMIIYISGGINRSNKAKGSVGSILEGILTFGSQGSPGLKGLKWTSFGGFAFFIILFKSSVVNCAVSSAFAFFLALISSSSTWLHSSSIGSEIEAFAADLVDLAVGLTVGLAEVVGFLVDVAVGLVGLLSLAEALGLIEGPEGAEDCVI